VKARCVVVANRLELPPAERIWGTGGWEPPENRQALDWVTLIHLLGWKVDVAYVEEEQRDPGTPDLIVFAGAGRPSPAWTELLRRSGERGATVIAPDDGVAERSRTARSTFEGTRVEWIGPGEPARWISKARMDATVIPAGPDNQVWAQLDGQPVVTARKQDAGMIVTLGFASSSWRDISGAGTALIRHLLIHLFREQYPTTDLGGLLVLRMDDPGSSQSTWCRSWSYPKLRYDQWDQISKGLKARDARLTIGYVPGWVDDGDPGRGELLVDGRQVPRRGGAVHDSWRVRYRDVAGTLPGTEHDLVSEYQGICALIRRHQASVELHGFTHMVPTPERWSAADDRYESMHWYRELGAEELIERPRSEHPLATASLRLKEAFDTEPTCLIPPGDEWTTDALEVALDLGIQLVNSYYLAVRVGDRFCWTTHVCSPYLDQPHEESFVAGLPVIGYFHDYELAVHGVGWMTSLLDRWQAAGASRMVDLGTLARLLSAT
jgi:hypothetical protein